MTPPLHSMFLDCLDVCSSFPPGFIPFVSPQSSYRLPTRYTTASNCDRPPTFPSSPLSPIADFWCAFGISIGLNCEP
ncbi:hypothetical protein L2E82_30137 [Cichorium intybus]|uniref:Uncharacterized protein n=1 Tax=Cichorium intybus TaxID=13427 RepID=A0ACB9CZP2_CICIN|nr:hypothetical protein L2E82_30137 [Cichorium intybus]